MATLPTCFGVLSKAGKAQVSVIAIPQPTRAREVLIKVTCAALNRADTLQRRGVYPPPEGTTEVMGLEAAGVVVSRGPGCVRAGFAPGVRVMALLPGGGFGQYAVVDEESLMRVPEGWEDVKAACVPEVFLTAFQLLHRLARVTPKDAVLIHAGASGVGTAAIQLAKVAGCQRIVATASKEKLAFLTALGATHAFDREEVGEGKSWADQVLRSGGVDVVLDPVGGSYAPMNLRVVNPDARWVLYGLMGGPVPAGPPEALLRGILTKRIALLGTTLRSRSNAYKGELVADFERMGLLDQLRQGTISPVLDSRVFQSLDEVDAALNYMESNKSIGKIALRVTPTSWGA